MFREEGRSAKSISGRPVLINLLEYCRKNKHKVQAVFVYRIDRVSRISSDYLSIRKKLGEYGTNVISITEPTGDSPTEKLVETILAGFAQLDNDIRSERSRNGLKSRCMSGLGATAAVPLGYTMQTGFAVKDPTSWDRMKEAWDLMATGTKSMQEMSDIMNKWGLHHTRGKKEYPLLRQRVNEIFRNKFYMGILSTKTYVEEVKGQHVPMVTEEQFYRVQAILDGRNPNKVALARRNFSNPDFPLRRIIRCSRCGMGLTGGWSKGRHAKYKYYRCGKPCSSTSIKIDELENTLMSLLKLYTPKQECLTKYYGLKVRRFG